MLGKQHLVRALLNLRAEVLAAKGNPSPALSYVRAKVLRHDTPRPVREAAAGESQYAQSGVRAVPLSGWARLLLSPDIQANPTALDRIYLALQRAGYERGSSDVCAGPPLHGTGLVRGRVWLAGTCAPIPLLTKRVLFSGGVRRWQGSVPPHPLSSWPAQGRC